MMKSAPRTLTDLQAQSLGAGLCPDHVRRIEGWVRRLAGPREDTEDVVQEVLIAAWRGHEKFRGDAKLTTWLFRITQKVVLKRRRSEGRFRRWLRRTQDEPQELTAAVPSGPAEDLERREKTALLYQALDRLSETYRTPLILFELEGLATEQIGELVGCTTNNVRVRLHRARALLFAELAHLQPDKRSKL